MQRRVFWAVQVNGPARHSLPHLSSDFFVCQFGLKGVTVTWCFAQFRVNSGFFCCCRRRCSYCCCCGCLAILMFFLWLLWLPPIVLFIDLQNFVYTNPMRIQNCKKDKRIFCCLRKSKRVDRRVNKWRGGGVEKVKSGYIDSDYDTKRRFCSICMASRSTR